MPSWWVWLSAFAFIFGVLYLLTSGFVIWRLTGSLAPLLTETKNQIQDLGDLAANTIGQAEDTMEIIEVRTSQTMGQAALAGRAATRQALGLGTILAGLYVVARFAQNLRPARKRGRRR
jgi:hypothetical protein